MKAIRDNEKQRHKQSIADPCMYLSRNENGELALWLSWVDNNLILGLPHIVKDEGKKLAKEIKIDNVGELNEFLGCKIKIDKLEQSVKFTQPVMIQSFLNEFGAGKKRRVTPAEPNSSDKTRICKNFGKQGIGKMMHMMRWSRLDIYNATTILLDI